MFLESYLQQLTGGDLVGGLLIFFALLIGHALGDHPLQGEYIALYKNRHNSPEPALDPKDQPTVWPHCLTAHALIHAGIVWVITNSPVLAVAELVLHWIIDFAKAERWTNIHVDQLLHVLCKAVFVIAIAKGWVTVV